MYSPGEMSGTDIHVDGNIFCLAGRQVMQGLPVGYMYRESPNFSGDSGWRFFTGDESEAYMRDFKNYRICTLEEICMHNRDISAFLHASEGASFLRDKGGTFTAYIVEEPKRQSIPTTLWWKESGERSLPVSGKSGTYKKEEPKYAQAILRHCCENIGAKYRVLRMTHLDFLLFFPNERHGFYTLVSLGMSSRDMHVPKELETLKLSKAELLICVQNNGPVENDLSAGGRLEFVPQMLEQIALAPFLSGNWLGYGHTVPNDSPARPYNNRTKLCGAILDTPRMFDSQFGNLPVDKQEKIHFYAVVPVYREEIELKSRRGADEVLGRIERRCGTLLDLTRRNTAKKLPT